MTSAEPRRQTLRSAIPPAADSQPTLAPSASADIANREQISAHTCDTWRRQLGESLATTGTKQDAFGAAVGMSQPNVSAMVTGADPTRKLTMDRLEAMRDSAVTHDAWLDFVRRHVGPGYTIDRAPVAAFDLNDAKVIELARVTNKFQRALLDWPINQGPQQMSFLLSGGELVLRGVGELVYSMRNQKRRKGR